MRIQTFVIILLLTMCFAFQRAAAAGLSFQFTLDEDATTSAGVFTTEGVLVKTLWRKVDYATGDHTSLWDGLTDENLPAPAGNYAVRILSHHADYIWDGAIGNTSTAKFGPTVHRGFGPIRDLTISGDNVFFTIGYNEGDWDFRHFLASDPQRVRDRWCWYYDRTTDLIVSKPGTIFSPDWVATDTDGTWVYFASPDSTDLVHRDVRSGPGFVVASSVADHKNVNFTKGAPIENGPADFPPFANGIKIGTKSGVSGLAVAKSGTLLAVSVRSENTIYLFHKRTGASLGSLIIPSPGPLAFAPNGDLLAISAKTIKRIVSPANQSVISTMVSNLSDPLDLAVHPNGQSIAVADGGSSQQCRFYNSFGILQGVLGKPGGYASNGPDISTDKWMFADREGRSRSSVAFGPDGSIWLSDPGTRRLLHFAENRSFLEEIMFQNASYSSGVDANNPTRVFCDFLEFAIDYSKPLAEGWKLVKNWAANLPAAYFSLGGGLRDVTTLQNGRTYATVSSDKSGREIVELTSAGLRFTGIILADSKITPGKFEFLAGNGNVRRGNAFDLQSSPTPGQRTTLEEKPLLGFENNFNPRWGTYAPLASAPAAQMDPVIRCCSLGDQRIPMTSSDVIVSFDPTKNPGWHLGGIKKGADTWLWKASPSVTSNVPLDGLGSFDIGDGVNYPGNSVFTSGRHIIFGYHGEFWNQSQAAQFMHFYDDGLFIGQFGESSWGHEPFEVTVPGLAGNSAFSCVTEVNGKVYLWANDESQHGPQRWLLSGTQTVREASATGELGQTNTLLIAAAKSDFPTGVKARAGDGRISLTWNGVAAARGYNIRMSTVRGGIGTIIAGDVPGSGKTINNLTNGRTYYFTVSAINSKGESVESDPASATPVSTFQMVELAGRYDQPGRQPNILKIFPPQPAAPQPALRKLNPLLGTLTLNNVGTAGYVLFRWNPTTLGDEVQLPLGDLIEPQGGWKTFDNPGFRFEINSVSGSNSSLFVKEPGGTGSISITPADNSLRYLTVVVPSRFRDESQHKISIAPMGSGSAVVSYETHDVQSINHIYQFRFQGPITLSLESIIGNASIQAIFLDRPPIISQNESGYSLWKYQNFSAADQANPNLVAAEADYDYDGESNLFEYTSGTSPTKAHSAQRLMPNVQQLLGDNYLTLRFVRDRNAPDVTVRVGVNSDLSNPASWTWIDPDDPNYLVSDLWDVPAKGLETLTIRDIMPAGKGPRFMRLSITQ